MTQITRYLFLGFILLIAFTLSACSSPEGDAKDGKRWYMLYNCSACHGNNGNDGEAIVVAPLDMSFYSFKKRLRRDDSQIMPYFPEEDLSDEDAADIYTFLKKTP